MSFFPSHPFENQEVDLLGPNQNFAKQYFAKYSPLIATVAKNIFDITSGGPTRLRDAIKESLIETAIPNHFRERDEHDAVMNENFFGLEYVTNILARMCWDKEPRDIILNKTNEIITCLKKAAMHYGYYNAYKNIFDDLNDHLADILIYWSRHIRKYCRIPTTRSALGVFDIAQYDDIPMKVPPTLSPEFIRTPPYDTFEIKTPYVPAKPITVRDLSHSDFIPIELFPSKVQSIIDIPPPFDIAGVEPIVP